MTTLVAGVLFWLAVADAPGAGRAMADALVDRFLQPYDAWLEVKGPELALAEEDRVRYYALRVRSANVHAAPDLYVRFALDPAERKHTGYEAEHGDDLEERTAYAQRYRAETLAPRLRFALAVAARDPATRQTIVDGSAALYWLGTADADLARLGKHQLIYDSK